MPKKKKKPTVEELLRIVEAQSRQLEELQKILTPGQRSKIYRPDVVEVLSRGPVTAREIADELGVDMWPVFRILQSMRADECVKLIEVDDVPRWKLIVKAEAADLQDWIETLIRENPLTQGDLEMITGGSRARVGGAITQLQRHKGAVGLGEKNWKQGWYIPTDGERDSAPVYEADPPKRSPTISEQKRRAARKRQRARGAASDAPKRANRSQSRRSRRDLTDEDPAKPRVLRHVGGKKSVVLSAIPDNRPS